MDMYEFEYYSYMSISYSFLYHRDTPIDSQIGWQILDA